MSLDTSLGKGLFALLFDPRGRASRQDLLVAATIMLALDMGLGSLSDGWMLYVLKAVAYWIGGVGIVKRLHDIGHSGWWFLTGAAALCMWSALVGVAVVFGIGFETLQPGRPGYIVLLAALMVPAMGATLWLHLAEGEEGMNRFGPAPSGVLALLAPTRGASSETASDL
jgi:uncharacterized membrane protein YhaH (DUF805 family)